MYSGKKNVFLFFFENLDYFYYLKKKQHLSFLAACALSFQSPSIISYFSLEKSRENFLKLRWKISSIFKKNTDYFIFAFRILKKVVFPTVFWTELVHIRKNIWENTVLKFFHENSELNNFYIYFGPRFWNIYAKNFNIGIKSINLPLMNCC